MLIAFLLLFLLSFSCLLTHRAYNNFQDIACFLWAVVPTTTISPTRWSNENRAFHLVRLLAWCATREPKSSRIMPLCHPRALEFVLFSGATFICFIFYFLYASPRTSDLYESVTPRVTYEIHICWIMFTSSTISPTAWFPSFLLWLSLSPRDFLWMRSLQSSQTLMYLVVFYFVVCKGLYGSELCYCLLMRY